MKTSPKKQTSIKSIAVFRMSALGDCLMVLTAIRALREHSPTAKITWIIEKGLLPLFENEEGIEFIAINKPRSISDYLNLRKQLAKYHFDVLLAMQASLRSNLIYPLIKANKTIGFDKTRGKELHGFFIDEQIPLKDEHLLEGFMSFISTLFHDFSAEQYLHKMLLSPSLGLTIKPENKMWADNILRPLKVKKLLVLNAAASKIERCCNPKFYSEILKLAHKQGFALVLTGGPAAWEVELSQAIESDFGDIDSANNDSAVSLLNLVGKTNLEQLAAVLDQADVVIAPDTGPGHLADLLGAKVIGLYAVAPPEQTGPYRNLDKVQNAYPLALAGLLNKQVDNVKWGTRIHHPEAMSFFKLEDIKSTLEEVYKQSKRV